MSDNLRHLANQAHAQIMAQQHAWRQGPTVAQIREEDARIARATLPADDVIDGMSKRDLLVWVEACAAVAAAIRRQS